MQVRWHWLPTSRAAGARQADLPARSHSSCRTPRWPRRSQCTASASTCCRRCLPQAAPTARSKRLSPGRPKQPPPLPPPSTLGNKEDLARTAMLNKGHAVDVAELGVDAPTGCHALRRASWLLGELGGDISIGSERQFCRPDPPTTRGVGCARHGVDLAPHAAAAPHSLHMTPRSDVSV